MSRKMMIIEEFPSLIAAQVQAARMHNYREWNDWMRKAFNFTLARRMAFAMGYEQPCDDWYEDMRLVGQRIMKELHEREAVNYTFREIAGIGEQETGVDHPNG